MPVKANDGIRFDILKGKNTLARELDRMTTKARKLATELGKGFSMTRGRRKGPELTPSQEARRTVSDASAQKRGIAAQRGVLRDRSRLVDETARVARKEKALKVDAAYYRSLSTAQGRELRQLVSQYNYRTGRATHISAPRDADPRLRQLLALGKRGVVQGQAAPRSGFVHGIREALGGGDGGGFLANIIGGAIPGYVGVRAGMKASMRRTADAQRAMDASKPGASLAGLAQKDLSAAQKESQAATRAFSRGALAGRLALGAGAPIALAGMGWYQTQQAVAEHEQYGVQLKQFMGAQAEPAYQKLMSASIPSRYGPGEFVRAGVKFAMKGDPDEVVKLATLASSISEATGQADTSQASRAIQGMLIKGRLDQEVLEPLRTLGIDFPMIFRRFLEHDEVTPKGQKALVDEMSNAEFRRWFFEESRRGGIQEEEVNRVLEYMRKVEFPEGAAAGTWHQVISTAKGQIELFLKSWGEFMGDLGVKAGVENIGNAAQFLGNWAQEGVVQKEWDEKTGTSTYGRRAQDVMEGLANILTFGNADAVGERIVAAGEGLRSVEDASVVRVVVEMPEGNIVRDTFVPLQRGGRSNIPLDTSP